ncbi:hypothetical protein H6F86_20905 [Phormidium sp. FACHB-592]|uniref:Uncharacterized protein n=1 Tax=Stenomitos frigidus AS-A4 TaxID=2933935 RepID=A0ABV0KEP2_9CYAN|nr:hypothetical protein [Phormidium sp. FACHB-592]MBD2076294.1 hypothetical protein [Phormidium sp. FACHB-592]
MYATLAEIAEFYDSPVLQKLGSPYTAFKRLIRGDRSRTAKDNGVTHHVITVTPWQGMTRDGRDFYRLRLATAGSYKVAAELTELFNL